MTSETEGTSSNSTDLPLQFNLVNTTGAMTLRDSANSDLESGNSHSPASEAQSFDYNEDRTQHEEFEEEVMVVDSKDIIYSGINIPENLEKEFQKSIRLRNRKLRAFEESIVKRNKERDAFKSRTYEDHIKNFTPYYLIYE
jgi:hypothetical protein